MEYGLVGEKLGHSFSRVVHERLAGYKYQLLPMDEQAFNAFFTQKRFKGVNVTIPYKQKVMPYCSYIHPLAAEIGAVNTVVNRNGILEGYNTDFAGLLHTVEKSGAQLKDKSVLILGSGGASKTAVAVSGHFGAGNVHIVSRKAADAWHGDAWHNDTLHNNAGHWITYNDIEQVSGEVVVINTTPVGMYPDNDAAPLDLTRIKRLHAVIDLIYNPLETRLLQQARALNVPHRAGGLGMLVVQAAEAVHYFTGGTPPQKRVEEVYQSLLYDMRNIVLVGMPASGKSTLGKAVAKYFGKRFVDMDKEIVKRAGKSIAEIFEQQGEDAFRKLESTVAEELAKEHGCVIATGGGAVKNSENMRRLRQNGFVVFVDRPLEAIKPGGGRPLSKSKADITALYAERYPLYKACCDASVVNSGTFGQGCGQMVALLEKEGFTRISD